MHISLPRRTEGRGQGEWSRGALQCTQTPFDTYVDKRETLQACVCMHGTTGPELAGRTKPRCLQFQDSF